MRLIESLSLYIGSPDSTQSSVLKNEFSEEYINKDKLKSTKEVITSKTQSNVTAKPPVLIKEEKASVKLIVDGLNFPYTAGNFIDLCLKEFYDNTPVKQEFFSEFDLIKQLTSKKTYKTDSSMGYSRDQSDNQDLNKAVLSSQFNGSDDANTSTSSQSSRPSAMLGRFPYERNIFGDFDEGYIDPITSSQRRIPLEVLRESKG